MFAELGWQTVSALEETFGPTGTLQRETKGEVVLASRLRTALERLNPALPSEAITAAVDELTRDRSAMSLEAANREVYLLLKEGIKVSVPNKERGGQKTERLRVIDWEYPENNNFLLVSQFSVTGALYTYRPDLVGFVNGLPLVVIELKKPGVPARAAFDENLTHYKQQIPALFWFNALLIASQGTDSRVGSLTADWERFFEWKRIEREDESRRVTIVFSYCRHRLRWGGARKTCCSDARGRESHACGYPPLSDRNSGVKNAIVYFCCATALQGVSYRYKVAKSVAIVKLCSKHTVSPYK